MWEEDASFSQPIIPIPESSYGEVQQDIAQAHTRLRKRNFNFKFAIGVQPTAGLGCAASLGSHSVKSKLERNKNGIQIYVSESGQEGSEEGINNT